MGVFILLFYSLCCGFVVGKPATANTPPMGWRTWNCWELNISQARIQAAIDAMSEQRPLWNGNMASLIDIGYKRIGIDEFWEECGAGVNGSFHDASGKPIINTKLFPDMAGLVKYAHDHQAYLDWYLNNCAPCNEHTEGIPANYEGDIQVWKEVGFDGVKVDGCGVAPSIQSYADQLESTGKPYVLENCNDPVPHPVPNQTWCPFHTFRTSDDISPMWESVVWNIQSIVKYLVGDSPLSRQGCWPQPDMMEVGNTNPPGGAASRAPVLTYNESRAHFGLWAVTSAPLILGHDVTDRKMTDAVWDIISNTEAIAINQVWSGHSGRLVQDSNVTYKATVFHGASNDVRDENQNQPTWQVWAKRLTSDGSSQAVLAVNYHPTEPLSLSLTFQQLGFPAYVKSATVRDVWAHQTAKSPVSRLDIPKIVPHDSVFVVLF